MHLKISELLLFNCTVYIFFIYSFAAFSGINAADYHDDVEPGEQLEVHCVQWT